MKATYTAYIEMRDRKVLPFTYLKYEELQEHLVRLREQGLRAKVTRVHEPTWRKRP